MGVLTLFFAILGTWRLATLGEFSGRYYITGRDEYGEALFGGGGSLLAAVACSFRLGILRAKLKAIRKLHREATS
jgi:hypothetical protein